MAQEASMTIEGVKNPASSMPGKEPARVLEGFINALADTSKNSVDLRFQTLASELEQLPRTAVQVSPHSTDSVRMWLDTALASMPPTIGPLTTAVTEIAQYASWVEAARGVPELFSGGYAYAILIGQGGMITSETMRLGLYLQRPEIDYPGHAHDAEEFYFILSGSSHWRVDTRHFTSTAGNLIHHPPHTVHASHTRNQPLLAVWAWLGDINGRYWFETSPETDRPFPL
jgi:mannose-6-phosphate isomerase-like protein (cupin superfamily)